MNLCLNFKEDLKKVIKLGLCFMMIFSCFTAREIHAVNENTNEYQITEDAYIRNGNNSSKNYDFENITKNHSSDYVGLDYKVINFKNGGVNSQIIGLMKLPLPTQQEIEENGYNTYEFVFNIFKNPDYGNGPQTYHFYYTTDTGWSENEITWNNKPDSVDIEGENLLFDFTVAKDFRYETLTDEEKRITVDVSDTIEKLVNEGTSAITIFVVAEEEKNTSLMIHSKESGNDGIYRGAKLVASVNQEAEYVVTEDAYVRQGRATTNYPYEEIGAAHGNQYIGKNIRTLSSKYQSSEEIFTLLKFDLPSSEDLEVYDKFELEFNIFKNPGYNTNPTQTYQFFYTTDTNWDETTLTWNNKPESVNRNSSNLMGTFTIEQGDEYEIKTDAEKLVRVDITHAVEKLVDEGVTKATFFITGQNSSGTSLMIHDRTSGSVSTDVNGDKGAKIIASKTGITLDSLKGLIEECKLISSDNYSEDSYSALQSAISEAEAYVQTNPTDARKIRDMYINLESAKNALVSTSDPDDTDNVAYQKPTRSNLSKDQTVYVNDGNNQTQWTGKFYPSYVDVDLMDTYDIEDIVLNFPENKVIYYTLYGSNDGKNYDEIFQHHSDEPKTAEGDVISVSGCQYRIIRVYLEYTKGDVKSYLSEIRVHGTKTNTNTEELRKGTFEEITGIQAYEDTEYAAPITQEETIENVYGIIDRTIGAEYRDWFTFEIAPNTENDYDYFELSDVNGKIHIKGNEGLSLTTGLNYYYKNYVNVQISEQTMQVNMPDSIVPIGTTVRKETPIEVRYAFNYCTLSYTFAFFGEEEWQRENDWLALNGVNVVLDLAGQEATWIKFLMNFGYSFDDAKDWLVGPGYEAWQFMQNMEVFGGPLPDGYVIDRVELARSTQRWKRSLGMDTVLQGYAGMVPTNFTDFYDVDVTVQGSWGGFDRPSMIATDSEAYDLFAEKFYEAQKFVYGDTTDYYAVDPFHEGGRRPSGLTDDVISKEVLESMLKYDPDAVWTVQGWQSNPTDKLLEGMGEYREDHVLVVDLIKYPLLSSGEAQYKKNEFQGTSWAWCLLGNFGGNPTMNGEVETMVNDILSAKKNSKHMKGIGIISEATYDNPMIYDLIFDLAWVDENFDLNAWVKKYIQRRYGAISTNAEYAWNLIIDANYDYGVRLTPEILGLRTGGIPAKLGKKTIGYDTSDLETALRLLLEDFDTFKDSEGYRYDLTEIMRQVASNYITLKYHEVIDARDSKDLEAFQKVKEEFLNAFDVLNEVTGTQQDWLGGEWIGKAEDRAENYDDFSMSAFKMNAKSLITTWGSTTDALIDYGFRTYEGAFNDVIKARWVEYLDQVEANIKDGTPITVPTSTSGYASFYWKWVIGDQDYTREAKDTPEDLKRVADRVLEECVFTGELDPNIGNVALNRKVQSRDVESGKASQVNDGMIDTSVVLSGNHPELTVDLIAEFQLSKIQVILDGTDNKAYQYEIYGSTDGKEWHLIAQKDDDSIATDEGVTHEITSSTDRYIKIVGTGNSSDQTLVIKEIRAYGERRLPELEALQRLVDYAETIEKGINSDTDYAQFQKALENAYAALEETSPDTVNTAYWNLYDAIVELNISDVHNVALNKPTEASNDPDGHSEGMVDGTTSTNWNSGRLSIPGKPYDHDTLLPGENIIDLEDVYNINELRIYFGSSSIWYNYEIYGSLDGEKWEKLAEKTTQTLPNEDEDVHVIETGQYRYIKLLTTNVQIGSDGRRNNVNVTELEVYGYEVADTTQLKAKIEELEKLDESLYTKESWENLKEELSYAKEIAEDQYSMQSDVTDALGYLNDAQLNLVYKFADYTALNSAILKATSLDKNLYKDFSAVEKALEAVIPDLDITHQEEVDAMAKAIEDAINALEYKDADYSKVNDAVTKANGLNKDLYKDFSAVEKALEAVNPDLDITQQEEVDAMAKAIEDAIRALEYKDADYSAVEKAKEKVPTDLSIYTEESVKALNDALAGVVEGKNITEQEEVDAMAKAIENAINGLVKKDTGNSDKPTEPTTPTDPETPSEPEGPNTSDNYHVAVFTGLMILSAGVLTFVLFKRKRDVK